MNLPYSNNFLAAEFKSRVWASTAVTALALSTLAFLSMSANVSQNAQIAIPLSFISVLVPYIVALYNRKRLGVTLQLTEDGISLPRFLFPKITKTVLYEAIYSKRVISLKTQRILRIDFVGGTYYFQQDQFEDPVDFKHFCQHIKENKNINTIFPAPIISYVITLLVTGFSLFLLYGGSSTPNLDMVSIGAWERGLILSGEIDRLISYGLIHENLVHLSTNMCSLILLGLALEHRVGRLNFLIIFSAGIVVSSLGAVLSNYFIIIGASGGIYSLLGAYVTDRYLHPNPNQERYKSTTNRFIFIVIAVEAFISFFFLKIAFSVHFFGFIFGAGYVYLLTIPYLKLKSQLLLGVLTLLLGSMFLIRLNSLDNRYVYDLSLKWLKEDSNPIRTEIGAWGIATSNVAATVDIEEAIQILEKSESTDNKIDTLATLYARQRRYLKALSIENSRIENGKHAATQLARFERAYAKDNPIDIKDFADAETIAIDAICDNKEFARQHTKLTDEIPKICNNQEIIYIRVAQAGAKNIRYELDPKFMALPL